jgi:signal transduction histidine kinase
MDFQRIFESSPVAILLVEAADPFPILAVTTAYLQATMTLRENVVGRGIFEVFPNNPAERDADGVQNLRASLQRVVSTGAADFMALQRYDIRRPDETFEERWWSPANWPFLTPDGTLRYILHRVDDVTDYLRALPACERQENETDRLSVQLRKAEAELFVRTREAQFSNLQLALANERLRAESTRKAEFLASIAHELRTPFTVLNLRLQHAKQLAAPADRKLTETLEKAQLQATRLLELVDSLIERDTADPQDAQPPGNGPIDLTVVIRKIVGKRRNLDRARVNMQLPDQPVTGNWDLALLEPAIQNVLDNAIKFGNGQPVDVRVTAEGPNAYVQVIDRGIGIAAEQQSLIFGRFERAAPFNRYPGLGLGLSIAANAVNKLGGEICLESQLSKGSTFTIRVPRQSNYGMSRETCERA